MSKISDIKTKQGYVPENPKKCATCKHLQKETETWKGVFGGMHSRDKNVRCGIGGFAVKKLGVCDSWSNADVEARRP